MSKFEQIAELEVGRSLNWENAPMSSGMIADAINRDGKQFEVRFICTNWEASQGYWKITRHALGENGDGMGKARRNEAQRGLQDGVWP